LVDLKLVNQFLVNQMYGKFFIRQNFSQNGIQEAMMKFRIE